ncbi:MAG: glycosyltransferase family 39 protein [Candidatus Binataceae bacterium]
MAETALTAGIAPASKSPRAPEEPPAAPIRAARWDLIAIAALGTAIFFSHLGSFGLWEPDESRYAEIAREMSAGLGWLVPHLNYVVYIEKPPLLYWLTALSFRLFGLNEFAARLPVALAALAGVIATWHFAYRALDRRRALLSAAILATCPLYAEMAQTLTTDMLLSALVTIATFTLFLHWMEGGRWCWLAYLAMALATLTKGPVGIALPVLAMAVFLAWNGELRGAIRRFHAIAGFVLMFALAAPWFIAVAIREPGYADFYFVGEYLKRALEHNYSHHEPFYYYLPVLVVGLLPWSLMAPVLAWRNLPKNPARRFCLCAAIVTVGAFSCASAKLIPYILPAFAPIAVLLADGIAACAWPETNDAVRPPDSRIPIETGPMLALLGIAAIAVALMAHHFRTPYVAAVRPALFAIGAILLCGGIATFAMFAARRAAAGLAAIVLTMAFALIAGGWARLEAEPLRSYAALSREVAEKAPGATLICYHRYVQSLAFYNRRRVKFAGSMHELDFGARRAPDEAEWFLKGKDRLLAQWNRPGPTVLVIDAPDLSRLRARLGKFDVIASEGHKRAIFHDEPAAAH